MEHIDFSFGKKKGESMSEEYGKLTLDIDWDRTQTVTYDKKQFEQVYFYALQDPVLCSDTGTHLCLQVNLGLVSRVPFNDDIVIGMQLWNHQRNAWSNYS